ncbi:MAG: PLP-dependent aminotransferase family protein [Synoicihabitans sp.]
MPTTTALKFSSLGERAQPPTIAKLMAMALENPNLLSIAAGFTDTASLPVKGVQRAVADLAETAGTPEFLQYGANQGRPELRRMLAEHLCSLEPSLDQADVQRGAFITNGSQQALYLAMQVLANPGDIVLVDRPSYFVFLEMLQGLGITAKSIPVDENGEIDGSAFDAMLAEMRESGDADRVRAIYFVSYFSNPSGRSLTSDEKSTIAHSLTRAELVIPVIEDAAYRDLYYQEPWPADSVLSVPGWEEFPKLYTSTLTKPFATGLKVGFATCTDLEWRAKMLHVKAHHDFGTANFNQALFEQVLENGGFRTQLRKIRPAYEAKMRVLDSALTRAGLKDLGWKWDQPAGGLYLWLTAPEGFDTTLESKFCHACVEEGVLYVPGELCFGDDAPQNTIRLSFGVLGHSQLEEAALRFCRVARRLSSAD